MMSSPEGMISFLPRTIPAISMLDFVFEYSKKSNIDFNILIPQNKDLCGFYFKRGFKK